MSRKITLAFLFMFALVSANVFAAVTLQEARADSTYTVQPGDSPARIAKKFGVTIEALLQANKEKYACLSKQPPCALQVGWVLAIPGDPPYAGTTNNSASQNNTPSQGQAGTYVVKSGDAPSKIAKKFGVTLDALVAANKQKYPCLPDCLRVGWVLNIPDGTGTVSQPVATSAPTTAAPVTTSSGDNWDLRLAVANEVNRVRQENGLAALTWNDTVAGLAQQRSVDMVTRNYFSHFDPETGALLSGQLMRAAGFRTGCETLARIRSAAIAGNSVAGWMASPGHRSCILDITLNLVGTGAMKGTDGAWYVTLLNTK